MVVKGRYYKTREQYVGLFTLLINDGEKTVLLSGPNRTGSTRDQVTDSQVEKNRDWALSKASGFELLGYSVAVQQPAATA